MFWELPEVSLLGTIRVFCSNAESPFGCGIFRTLCSVLWLFTSCVWDVLRYRILRKKQLLIFSETWSSSFWIVCNCFDDFRTNRLKSIVWSHRKENTNFAKWRWVSSKSICSSSALLFSLVVTKKYVLRTPWRSLYLEQYVFFVQMPSHVLAAVFFERYVRYFGSLHPAFEMSCDTEYLEKNSFWFIRKRGLRRFGLYAIVLMTFAQTVRKVISDFSERKTPTLQNDVECVPKMSVWALLCFFLWL